MGSSQFRRKLGTTPPFLPWPVAGAARCHAGHFGDVLPKLHMHHPLLAWSVCVLQVSADTKTEKAISKKAANHKNVPKAKEA